MMKIVLIRKRERLFMLMVVLEVLVRKALLFFMMISVEASITQPKRLHPITSRRREHLPHFTSQVVQTVESPARIR
jgi:hypothetical protein